MAVMHIETWFPTPEPSARRPVGVWVITGVYVLLYTLVVSAVIWPTPEYRASMAALGVVDTVLMWINSLLDIAGVACLFLLRRAAVPLLGAALVVSVISLVGLAIGVWRGGGVDTFTLVGSFVMLPLPVGVWWDARRLRQRGVLR